MPWLYDVGRVIVRLLFFLLTRLRVRGRDNIPKKGPVLVVANHLNLVDPPLVGLSLGRRAVFMAKQELFRSRLLAGFLNALGVFPVNRGRLHREALHKSLKLLENGQALIVFPEGTRSRRLNSASSGAALIASRSGAPILPVGIAGTEEIKGLKWFLRRPVVTVSIGPPFYPPPVDGRLTKQRLAELTDIIMGSIADLLPVEYHGNYAERKA